MTLDDIEVAGGPLVLSTSAEVTEAEATLGARFPEAYRDYVTRFGEGTLGGTFVRVYPPRRILGGIDDNNVHEWRERCREYWSWDENPHISLEAIDEFIILGDTVGGDEFCFGRDDRETIIILPRDGDEVSVVDGGLLDAIEWMCASGVLTEPFEERRFVPLGSKPS